MELEKIPVENAVGKKIGHDMTQIIPGEYKGARFERGHIIQKDDIAVLKNMGKEYIYIMDIEDGYLHEDAAACRLSKAVAGKGIVFSDPGEGKIYLRSEYRGLLKINLELLFKANMIDDILISAGSSNTPVERGEDLAGVRVNPVVVEESKVEAVEERLKDRVVFSVLPYTNPRVGLVVTGNEVYSGRIEDMFRPAIEKKMKRWGGNLIRTIYVPDNQQMITDALLELKEEGADLLITGGGMSVDPDDVTPSGITAAGAEVISFGAPVAPGNKSMLAYIGDIPVIGLPAAVIFYEITVFDLIYPRLLAGEKLNREDIVRLGHGGLCHHCNVCQYPYCSFGKAY